MTSSGHDPAVRACPDRRGCRRARGTRLRGRPVGAAVPLPATAVEAVLDRACRPRHLVGPRTRIPAGHRRHYDRGRRRRRQRRAGPPRRHPHRAVLSPGGRQLPPDVPPRSGGRAGRRSAPGRSVRAPRDAVTRLLRGAPGRRARVAPVERRDARAHDADPDDHQPAVVGHRPGRLDHHPVPAQPDAAAHRAAPGASADRGGDRLRAAAPACQHPGPGHHRAQHDDRRGGAVGHPRREELRARGVGARALRRRPAERRGDRLAPGHVAGRRSAR